MPASDEEGVVTLSLQPGGRIARPLPAAETLQPHPVKSRVTMPAPDQPRARKSLSHPADKAPCLLRVGESTDEDNPRGRLLRRNGEGGQAYGSDAHFQYSQASGSRPGEVNDPAFHEGASIVNPNFDGAPTVQPHHADPGLKGKSPVGGGQRFHVVPFAVGRFPAVVGEPVP